MRYPITPDGRYFVVRGRLWRMSNPALSHSQRQQHTKALMVARQEVGRALRSKDVALEKNARGRVKAAKLALGERGPRWWSDGAPDYNRHMVENTPYREWYKGLSASLWRAFQYQITKTDASMRAGTIAQLIRLPH